MNINPQPLCREVLVERMVHTLPCTLGTNLEIFHMACCIQRSQIMLPAFPSSIVVNMTHFDLYMRLTSSHIVSKFLGFVSHIDSQLCD
jgi:hypothetical protein